MSEGFIKLLRCKKTKELMKHPNAFTLLSIIAYRARRTNNSLNLHGLDIGEALVGDITGRMTEQQYRTAKKQLTKAELAVFKGTNRGTIAKLTDNGIYDINPDEGNEQDNEQATSNLTNKQRASNEQPTTNKEIKKGKNDKKERKNTHSQSFKKPSTNEVNAYAESIGYALNAQSFVDYYEARGWMLGKTRMKSWRAAVRTWRDRDNGKGGGETLEQQFARLEQEGQI